jgi:hypothetical protein
MILVTVVALSLWGTRTWRWWSVRRSYCQRKALECADLQQFYLTQLSQADRNVRMKRWKVSVQELKAAEAAAKRCGEDCILWEKWRSRYEQAAIFPWVSLPPDLVAVWREQYEARPRRGEWPPRVPSLP